MARELRIFLFALLGTILLFAIITAILPDRWEVRRTATLPASQAAVMAQFADFNNWQRWSPVARSARSDTRISIAGEPGKAGHTLTWDAGPQRAVLRMEEVTTDTVRLVFLSRSSADSDMVEFGRGTITVTPSGDGTEVAPASDVVWLEVMDTVGIAHKWFAWFGVQQKTQGEQIDVSFTQLRVEFDEAREQGK